MQHSLKPGSRPTAIAPAGIRTLPSLVPTLLLGITLFACSSSRSEEDTGTLLGVVEQVLHHGARPEEGGPAETISAVHGARVVVHGLQAELVDSTTTDMAGRFEFHLPEGSYRVAVRPIEGDDIPTSTPEDRIVEITSDAVVELTLRYDVYAP